MKPECPVCKSRKWISAKPDAYLGIKFLKGVWYLCSKCGSYKYSNKWEIKKTPIIVE